MRIGEKPRFSAAFPKTWEALIKAACPKRAAGRMPGAPTFPGEKSNCLREETMGSDFP